MEFGQPAPGLLHDEGSSFVGYWDVAPDNFGHTEAEVVAWVNSALNDPQGWGRAGITFERSATATPRVLFRVVETISGDPGIIGFTFNDTFNGDTMDVWLEAGPYFGTADLVTHEAAHAYFFAEHASPGSDSIMEPQDEAGNEWPSEDDIQSVIDWLGLLPDMPTPDDYGLSAFTNPGLPPPHRRDLSRMGIGLGAIRVHLGVGEPMGAVWVQMVWSPTLAGLSDAPQALAPALPGSEAGHYSTGWRAIPEGALDGRIWCKSITVPDGPGFETPREYRPRGRPFTGRFGPGPWLELDIA